MSNYTNKIVYFLILISLFNYSCKKATQGSAREQMIKKLYLKEIEEPYIKAKAKIKYSEGKQNIAATASFRIKKDSIIWISVSPGLGIEALRCRLTQDSIIYVNKLEKNYSAFKITQLKEIYKVDLDFKTIQSLLLGELINDPSNKDKIEPIDSDKIILSQKDNDYIVNTTINTNLSRIQKMSVDEESKNRHLNVNFDDFKAVRNINIAHKSTASLEFDNQGKKQKMNVNLKFVKIDFPQNPLTFPFVVPSHYERK